MLPRTLSTVQTNVIKSRPMTKDTQAVLFDLDGTLADTLADLANAVNWALTRLDCPAHPVRSYRQMVGDGARNLCSRALPDGKQGLAEDALRLMREHYEAHCFDMTRLYPEIPGLVSALTERGYKLAVLSNKPDDFTKGMIAHYFPPSAFDIVRGQRPGVPLKPDPTAARQIAAELGIPPGRWLYLGDTNTDMLTARAAGMHAVGVLWGFRERDELEKAGAERLIQRPLDVLKLL
jgi:phosphoglycolate phosphatase